MPYVVCQECLYKENPRNCILYWVPEDQEKNNYDL